MDCGVEEPLSPNQQLTAASDRTIELAEFGIPKLNRYSFVANDTSPEAMNLLVYILSRVVSALATEALWLTAWEHHDSGDLDIRTRVLNSRLTTAGWKIGIVDGIGIGVKPIPKSTIEMKVPAELGDRLGWAVILGRHHDPQAFMQSPLLRTLKFFASNRRFCPSREFLERFDGEMSGLAYLAHNSSDMRVGLVLVLPVSLQLMLRRLLEEKIVSKIYRNADASVAWL